MRPEDLGLPVLAISAAIPAFGRDPAENARFCEVTGKYCADLIESLELPIRPEVTLSRTGSDKCVRLIVGENEVTIDNPKEGNPDTYALAVCRAVYRSRESLVTEDAARRLWGEWLAGRAPSSADAALFEGFIWLLKEAARYGLRAGSLRSGVTAESRGLLDRTVAERIFEESAGQLGPGSLRLFLSRPQHARCFDGDKARPLVGEDQDLPKMLDLMADGLFQELGILYRLAVVETDDKLDAPWFRVQWNDVPAPSVKGLAPDEFLVNDTVDRLKLLNLEGTPAINPANGTECAILGGGEEIRKIATQAGLTTWGPEGYVVLHARAEIRSNAGAFVNLALLDLFTANLSEGFPDLIHEAVSRFARVRLCRILRLLAKEEISIRDMRTILDSLLAVDGTTSVDFSRFIVFAPSAHFPCPTETGCQLVDLRSEHYAECARMALKRYISHKYTRGSNTLVVYLMDPKAEGRFKQSAILASAERSALIKAVREEVGKLPPTAQNPVILTTYEIRPRLWAALHPEFPYLPVLSYQDLSPDMNIQPIARISLDLKR